MENVNLLIMKQQKFQIAHIIAPKQDQKQNVKKKRGKDNEKIR